MASRMLETALALSSPWLTQPGRLGHSTTQKPSSPGYRIICRMAPSTNCPKVNFTLNIDGNRYVGARALRRRHLRAVHGAIEGVALDGDAAGFADEALEFQARGELGGLCAGVVINFFLDDGAVKIVRAKSQR